MSSHILIHLNIGIECSLFQDLHASIIYHKSWMQLFTSQKCSVSENCCSFWKRKCAVQMRDFGQLINESRTKTAFGLIWKCLMSTSTVIIWPFNHYNCVSNAISATAPDPLMDAAGVITAAKPALAYPLHQTTWDNLIVRGHCQCRGHQSQTVTDNNRKNQSLKIVTKAFPSDAWIDTAIPENGTLTLH